MQHSSKLPKRNAYRSSLSLSLKFEEAFVASRSCASKIAVMRDNLIRDMAFLSLPYTGRQGIDAIVVDKASTTADENCVDCPTE
jgi:hypothetical protein